MLFKNSLFALASVFATLAFASPEPQTPAQTTQAEQDLISYAQALQTDPAFLSFVSVYETDTAGLKSISDWEASVSSQLQHHETPAANFISALPTNVQELFGSIYTVEASIFSKNGFTVQTTGSATPTKNAAQPTAHAVGAAAAGLAAFMGVVAAL